MTSDISASLTAVRQRIAESERQYARAPGSVQLIAVSKTQSCDRVRIACEAGQHHFGENYVQEALDKMAALADCGICWHFIGPIQSNKTRALAMHFDWVHTVDRDKIAQRLNDQRAADKPALNVLLQVNISNEASKSGASLAVLPALADTVAAMSHLQLRGLMAIPAASNDFDAQRHVFRQLAVARDQLIQLGHADCTELSMGMSQDYQAAIAEGATMVRIGSDIFGMRSPGTVGSAGR